MSARPLANAQAPLMGLDLLAALGVVVIWGLNFVAMKFSLRAWSPTGEVLSATAPSALMAIGARGRLPVQALDAALRAARTISPSPAARSQHESLA